MAHGLKPPLCRLRSIAAAPTIAPLDP